jgi:cellulose biosynthesis protein BcsQ
MSYSRSVYFGGRKGGSTKTTTSHLVCLGAILSKQPAAYVLTDPHRELKENGRPYNVMDGRQPQELAKILGAIDTYKNGWWIFDGGGNRPALDAEMAAQTDLVILPFRDSEEDVEAVTRDMHAYPNALAWPCAWPTNPKAQQAAQHLTAALALAFPLRVISTPLYFVNSAKELLGASLDNPSTPTRKAARRAFDIMADAFDTHVKQAHDLPTAIAG